MYTISPWGSIPAGFLLFLFFLSQNADVAPMSGKQPGFNSPPPMNGACAPVRSFKLEQSKASEGGLGTYVLQTCVLVRVEYSSLPGIENVKQHCTPLVQIVQLLFLVQARACLATPNRINTILSRIDKAACSKDIKELNALRVNIGQQSN